MAGVGLLDLRRVRSLNSRKIAIAYSGGPDATALAARLVELGATVIPVYVQYRNAGGKTVKDKRAALASAELLGLDTEFIDQAPLIKPISSDEKPWRNRIMLATISAHFAERDRQVNGIALGTYQACYDAAGQWTADSNDDLDPKLLAARLADKRHRLITWDGFGIKSKADQFRGLSRKSVQALFATVSCQMWWRIECGNCYSCIERNAAFLDAFGKDPTKYRPGTTVG